MSRFPSSPIYSVKMLRSTTLSILTYIFLEASTDKCEISWIKQPPANLVWNFVVTLQVVILSHAYSLKVTLDINIVDFPPTK